MAPNWFTLLPYASHGRAMRQKNAPARPWFAERPPAPSDAPLPRWFLGQLAPRQRPLEKTALKLDGTQGGQGSLGRVGGWGWGCFAKRPRTGEGGMTERRHGVAECNPSSAPRQSSDLGMVAIDRSRRDLFINDVFAPVALLKAELCVRN